jgi:hypothetical protein
MRQIQAQQPIRQLQGAGQNTIAEPAQLGLAGATERGKNHT